MHEILYGRQAVRESLCARRRHPFRLLLAEGNANAPILDDIVDVAKGKGLPIQFLPRHELAHIAGTDNHQGVALETSLYPYTTSEDMLMLAHQRSEAPFLLILDLIQDVHNLGSLIRTAEAVGVHGILVQERRAAGITPAAVNTSSGATEHLYIARVTNLAREIDALKAAEVWIAGLEDTQDAEPLSLIHI